MVKTPEDQKTVSEGQKTVSEGEKTASEGQEIAVNKRRKDYGQKAERL